MSPACLQDQHQPAPSMQGPASMQRQSLTQPCCMPAEAAPAPAPGAGLPAFAAAASLGAPAPAPVALLPAAGASLGAPAPAPEALLPAAAVSLGAPAPAPVALLPAAGASQAPAPAPQSAAATIASLAAPAPAPSDPSCQTGLQGYLQSNPNLTLLTTALSGSTQVSVQNPFTFFAPLDTAFQAIPGDLGELQLLSSLQWGSCLHQCSWTEQDDFGYGVVITPQGRTFSEVCCEPGVRT